MNKRAEDNKPSVGELGWQAAGVLGGGAAGYALSRILHGKPKGLRALAYILAGMGTGGMGMHYALDNIKTSDGRTWRELLRSADEMMPVWEQRRETIRNDKADSHMGTNLASAALALAAGIQGASAGKIPIIPYLDVSGRRAANAMYKHQLALRTRPGKDPIKFINDRGTGGERETAAINAFGGKNNIAKDLTLKNILRHPWQSRRFNIVNMVANMPAPDGNLDFGGLTTRGNAANIALDAGINAAVYGLGTQLIGRAIASANKSKNDTKRLMDDMIYKGK